MIKVFIASSRSQEIGERCREYADDHLPEGYVLCDSPDLCDIFISVLYDTIVSKKFIESKIRCVNFHPGVLPDYRGAGAYSWAIINKEKFTGVTLHEIDHNIDSGPIIDIQTTLIHPQDTAESLFGRCMDILYEMFQDYFIQILSGSYQDSPNVGGNIYLRKDLENAKDITHIVRAFTFKGKENAYFYNHDNKKIFLNYTED